MVLDIGTGSTTFATVLELFDGHFEPNWNEITLRFKFFSLMKKKHVNLSVLRSTDLRSHGDVILERIRTFSCGGCYYFPLLKCQVAEKLLADLTWEKAIDLARLDKNCAKF